MKVIWVLTYTRNSRRAYTTVPSNLFIRRTVKMGRKKYTYEQIKQAFESEGYTLLSTEYKKYHDYLDFICPNGHIHKIFWSSFNGGIRCGKCYNFKHSYEQIKQSFESEGYTLLSTEYTGNKKHLDFICLNGHKHKIVWAHWQSGVRCGRCFGNIEVTYNQVKQAFEAEGYTLLSTEYVGNKMLLDFICPNGHVHKIKWNSFSAGARCGICAILNCSSKSERELQKWIVEHHPDILTYPNDRTMIQNPLTGEFLELDIWMPEIKKAIEYNGIYWHSGKYVKWKDAYKTQWCKDNGIELMVIDHNEWIKNKDFSIISSFINN